MADELKKSRTGRKSALSRSINDLRKFMIEDDVDNVRDRVKTIREKLSNFEEAHDQYVDAVKETASNEDIEANDTYYTEM